jgi:hypothetical protein
MFVVEAEGVAGRVVGGDRGSLMMWLLVWTKRSVVVHETAAIDSVWAEIDVVVVDLVWVAAVEK